MKLQAAHAYDAGVQAMCRKGLACEQANLAHFPLLRLVLCLYLQAGTKRKQDDGRACQHSAPADKHDDAVEPLDADEPAADMCNNHDCIDLTTDDPHQTLVSSPHKRMKTSPGAEGRLGVAPGSAKKPWLARKPLASPLQGRPHLQLVVIMSL